MARSDVRQATFGGDSIQERSDTADIFVSYARSDRPSVQLIARALEASGRTVWWDREVLPGHEFETVIQTELDRASCVLVVWSSTSIASNWVRNEAALGR